jgi:tetratricopeptide (TPR) repeat protein
MDAHQPEAMRLRKDVEWALRSALDPHDVVPMLHRLSQTAAVGSDESIFAHRQLAELLVERHPWRAALFARRVLAYRPEDDRAWAVLGLCQTLLGHYRFAVRAYHRALTCSPNNPWYAHNLGHLLDVALGRAEQALAWLRIAYNAASNNREIASSYAHALARCGEVKEAKRILARTMKRGVSREQAALWKWLEEGAPAGKDMPRPRRTPETTRSTPSSSLADPRWKRRRPVTAEQRPLLDALESTLASRLVSLPFDPKQRSRARLLARDTVCRFAALEPSAAQSVAAAIAYAIVYVDHMPLTQAEVAACFRVSVASLRSRFSNLRVELDLTPGDARYASPRNN